MCEESVCEELLYMCELNREIQMELKPKMEITVAEELSIIDTKKATDEEGEVL